MRGGRGKIERAMRIMSKHKSSLAWGRFLNSLEEQLLVRNIAHKCPKYAV